MCVLEPVPEGTIFEELFAQTIVDEVLFGLVVLVHGDSLVSLLFDDLCGISREFIGEGEEQEIEVVSV